jgi:hypothetical protein
MMFLISCSFQKVRKTPVPKQYMKIDDNFYDDGFPKQRQPWIVFSDRSNNKVNPTKKEDADVVYKETSLLAPFLVLEKKNGMFKVADYKPDLINDGKIPKTKGLKVLGWIPEEHLLLWSNSLKKSESGFASKAAIVINHTDVIRDAERYIENDSAIVFTSPDLINKTKKKISLGSIVYIYKQSEDKGRVLIGKEQSVTPDSAQSSIYGWISKNMMSIWGERSSTKVISDSLAIKLKSNENDSVAKPHTISNELNQRSGMWSICPINSSNHLFNQIKFFTNVFDYDKNKIYNVLGNPIFYKRYREILSNNRKLNIVFVLDVSKNNRLYIPVAKSLLQELQLNFVNPGYFSTIKFGGVVYKQNSCDINPLYSTLSNNYRDITLFFEDKIDQLTCSDTEIAQPVDKGLLAATKMLSGSEDETNLIILIGTTADQNAQNQTINALTRVNAKLIFFQTQSKSADAYNDFVLLGEKSVVNSATNIAERKKEKIVNQNDLLIDNNFSLTTGENGIYYLDFPKKNMTQGFVIFPKKGETMQAGVLKTAIDTLLVQVTNDNKKINNTLTKYFRSEIGVNNTRFAELYTNLFPFTDKLIPAAIASSLLNQNSSFLIDGVLTGKQDSLQSMTKRGILLNELEYEQLRSFYTNVYKSVLTKDEFIKRKSLRTYLKIISKSTLTLKKTKRNKLKKMPMRDLVRITTDFPLTGNTLMDMTPKEWIKSKKLKTETVLEYFEQFREIAAKMGVSKGDNAIRVEYEGQVFYWLSDEYVPVTIKSMN